MTRLDRYLEEVGQTEPLSIAPLLDELDWSEFEGRYAKSKGRFAVITSIPLKFV